MTSWVRCTLTRQRRPRSSPRTTWGGTPRSSWPTKPCARKTAGKEGESSSAAARHATGMASALTGRKRITSATHEPLELCLHQCTLNTENGTSRTSSSVIQTVLRSLTVTRAPRVRSAYLDMYIEIRVSPACHLAVGPGRRITITRSTSARCSCSTPSSQMRSAKLSPHVLWRNGVSRRPRRPHRAHGRHATRPTPSPTAPLDRAAPRSLRTDLPARQPATPGTPYRDKGRAAPATSATPPCATPTRAMHPAPSPTALRALPAPRSLRTDLPARQPATPGTPYRDKGRAAPAPSTTPPCATPTIALPP